MEQERKRLVRQAILKHLRQGTGSPERAQHIARLRHMLLQELGTFHSLCVGIYAAMPHEVNLLPLLQEAPGHRYAFPRCQSENRLNFHEVRVPERDLEPGQHGILAPRSDCPLIEPGELDILIVPGVAFTRRGARLGYGGGYYDRYIPLCSHARIIALALPEQLLDTLPEGPHDQRIPVLLHL